MLRLFADVRAGEGATVLLLALNLFLLLTAYSLIKPVRDALILAGGGAEVKSYLSAGLVLLLLLVVPAYGRLADRMPRRRLINVVTVFFSLCLVAFFLFFRLPVSLLAQGIVFFLWAGIFNVMVIAQLWAFANDVYTSEEGERLFPIVAVGASLGAVSGSFISGGIIRFAGGVYQPMLLAALVLLVSLLVTNRVDARERRRSEADLPPRLTTGSMPAASQEIPLAEVRMALSGEIPLAEVRRALTGEISLEEVRRAVEEGERRPSPEETRAGVDEALNEIRIEGSGENPYAMVLRCPYLLLIALLVLLMTWVNTNGGYILDRLAGSAAAAAAAAGGASAKDFLGAFFSSFNAGVNTLGLLLQLFFVSRAIRYLGMRTSLLLLPIIALGTSALIAIFPVLAWVRWAKTAENATDYSLQNTVRNALFLPCTREQKYQAKQAIDAFFFRAGDVSSAGLVFVGTAYLALDVRQFAVINLVLVGLALTIAVAIGRQYVQLVRTGRPPCVAPGMRPGRLDTAGVVGAG